MNPNRSIDTRCLLKRGCCRFKAKTHLYSGAAAAVVYDAQKRRSLHGGILGNFEVDLGFLHVQQSSGRRTKHDLNAAKLLRVDQRVHKSLVRQQWTGRFPSVGIRLAGASLLRTEVRAVNRNQHSGHELHRPVTAGRKNAIRTKGGHSGLRSQESGDENYERYADVHT